MHILTCPHCYTRVVATAAGNCPSCHRLIRGATVAADCIRSQNVWNSELWNCSQAFDYQCPLEWDRLEKTGDPDVRHCETCDQDVYMCSSPAAFVANGSRGRCVAIPATVVPNRANNEMMGRPSAETLRRLATERQVVRAWWKEVSTSSPAFAAEGLEALEDLALGDESRDQIDEFYMSLEVDRPPTE